MRCGVDRSDADGRRRVSSHRGICGTVGGERTLFRDILKPIVNPISLFNILETVFVNAAVEFGATITYGLLGHYGLTKLRFVAAKVQMEVRLDVLINIIKWRQVD